MADGVVLAIGATVGTRDTGTIISQDDAETQPIVFARVGQVIDVYYRGAETGRRSTTPLVVRCPSAVQASADGGLNYADVVTLQMVADTYKAFKLKQVGAAQGQEADLITDALAWETVAMAPELTATPSITPGTTDAIISATAFDPNGDTPTILYRVVTRGATPNWTGAPSLTGYNPGSATATGLNTGTDYDLYLRAQDPGGLSNTYGPYPFTTGASVPDTDAPTWPGGSAGLTVNPSGTSLVCDWANANDNVGVQSYSLERSDNGTTGWSVVATPTASNHTDSIGSPGVTRYYRVRARDAAGNWSAYSAVANATTASDTAAPSLSGALTLTPMDGGLYCDWPAATDAVGVTRYVIEHSANSDYSSATTVNVDGTPPVDYATITGLTNGAVRYVRVKAQDAAGNSSAWLSANKAPYVLDTAATSIQTDIYASVPSQARRFVRLPDGTLLYAYEKQNGPAINVWLARSTNNGSSWTNTNMISSTTIGASQPTLAFDSTGKAYYAYAIAGAAWNELRVSTSTNGGATWTGDQGGASLFTEATESGTIYPHIVVDGSDNLHMWWGTGNQATVRYAKRTAGTWGSAETVHTATVHASTRHRPVGIVTPNGDVWCAYTTYNGTNHLLNVEKRGASSWNNTPIAVVTHASDIPYSPNLLTDSNGYLHLFYSQAQSGQNAIRYARSTNGTSFSTPITISDEASYSQTNPQATFDRAGKLAVVWDGMHAGSTTYKQVNMRTCAAGSDPTNAGNWAAVTHLTSAATANAFGPMIPEAYFPRSVDRSIANPSNGYGLVFLEGTATGAYAIKYLASGLTWQV